LTAFFDDGAVGFLIFNLVNLLFYDKVRIAHTHHFNPSHHLADDNLDMLVVYSYTLQAVNLLDFINQVTRQGHLPLDVEDILRNCRTPDKRFSRSDIVTLIDVNVFPPGNQIFFLFADIHRCNRHFLLAFLGAFGDRHIPVNLAEHRNFLWFSHFKQFRHSWQTTGDVLGFSSGPGQFGHHVTGLDGISLFHQ